MPAFRVRRAVPASLLGVLLLALLPLLGPGCGSSSNGGDGGEEACTLLPPLGPTKPGPLQVSLEVRFVTTDRTFLRDLGVGLDFGLLTETDPGFSTFGTPGDAQDLGVFPNALGGAVSAWGLVQSATPDGAGVPILYPGLHDPFASSDVGVFPICPGPGCLHFQAAASRSISNLSDLLARSPLTPDPLATDFSIFGSFLDDAALAVLLATLEAESSTRMLVAPLTQLHDEQRALIQPRNRVQVPSDLVPGFREAVEAIDPMATVHTGPLLDVVPTITADDRIRLEVRPATQAVTTIWPQMFDVGPELTPSLAEIPIVRTRSVRTTVIVPNGETLVLGGLLQEPATTPEVGVPILGDIPVLSHLFGPPRHFTDRRNLLILVTARLVEPN